MSGLVRYAVDDHGGLDPLLVWSYHSTISI
jgi:hypothetical protein